MDEKLTLTQEWDKTFPKSDKADHRKATIHNRYGIMDVIPFDKLEAFFQAHL